MTPEEKTASLARMRDMIKVMREESVTAKLVDLFGLVVDALEAADSTAEESRIAAIGEGLTDYLLEEL